MKKMWLNKSFWGNRRDSGIRHGRKTSESAAKPPSAIAHEDAGTAPSGAAKTGGERVGVASSERAARTEIASEKKAHAAGPVRKGLFMKRRVPDADERDQTRASSNVAPPSSDAKADIVDESLTTIYEGRPSKEWMNTFDRGRRKTWLIALGSLVLFLVVALAATWAGIFWFNGRGFSGQKLAIAIEGPQAISIGQEVTYFVNWVNPSKEPLASLEFRVSFPNDFVLMDASPKPSSSPLSEEGVFGIPRTLSFRLGAQPVEARGTLKFVGRFTGALGTKSAIQVISTYRPASFNSDFEALETKDISYDDSILNGSLKVPSKVVPGDVVTLAYAIENTGVDAMPDLVARFTLPDGFIPASGTAIGTDGLTPTFDVGTIEPGASSTVAIRGSFSVDAHGDQAIRADAGIFTEDGAFASAQKSEASISVLAGDLKIDLIVNGSQADRSVNPGDIQRISIVYSNTSGETLKDATLTLYVSGVHASGGRDVTFADWSALAFGDATGTRKGNAVSFTKAGIPALGELAPDTQGTIDLSVPILAKILSENDVPVSAYVEAKIGAVGDVKVNRIVKTTPITLRIRSDAKINAAARYASDEGIRLGSGPLPPVVGSSTTYRIEWHVTKTIHELSRLTVSATLPNGIGFGSVKEVGAGDVGFDPEKKLVTWSVNRMPEDIENLIASFDVVLSPSEADVGRFASLLGETRLEFTDTLIGESVLRTSSPLTTELPDDSLAKKKGVVARD